MKTGIIIPCHNEGNKLNKETFIQFVKEKNDYHFCFVNDGSKDDTLSVLNQIKKEAPSKVSIIDVKKNKGKAAAVKIGARCLFHEDDIEYIGYIDCCLSTDLNSLKKLIETLKKDNKLSFVYGKGKSNGQIERNPFRKIVSEIIKTILFFILGLLLYT